jgi:hypothetical protein
VILRNGWNISSGYRTHNSIHHLDVLRGR